MVFYKPERNQGQDVNKKSGVFYFLTWVRV
jgi:hypothetical protein